MTTFEDRLLVELKGVVAERAVAERRPSGARRRPVRLFALAGAVVAAAAGIAVAVPLATGEDGAKANAVERRPDGSIAVHWRDFDHPEQVEAKLRGFGVPARVTTIPSGKQCRDQPEERQGGRAGGVFGPPGALGPNATTIYPGRLRPGQFLAINIWTMRDEHGKLLQRVMQPGVAQGPIGPCVLVPGGPGVQTAPMKGQGPGGIEKPTPTPSP
ncbi:hypothetical protein [Actinomadura roseirufa]|uniref:hypothetical protein n=1 Tax=Actinomadura roseirufa TaxID=2094049 RepID=UPI0010414534|nr:hypothetical protein [Actinomadura roseirufa]